MESKENTIPTSEEEQARAIYEQLLERHPGGQKLIQIEWEENPSLANMKELLEMECMLF